VDLLRPPLPLFSLHIDAPPPDPRRPQAAIGVVSPLFPPQSEQLFYLYSFFSLPKQPASTSLALFFPNLENSCSFLLCFAFPQINQCFIHMMLPYFSQSEATTNTAKHRRSSIPSVSNHKAASCSSSVTALGTCVTCTLLHPNRAQQRCYPRAHHWWSCGEHRLGGDRRPRASPHPATLRWTPPGMTPTTPTPDWGRWPAGCGQGSARQRSGREGGQGVRNSGRARRAGQWEGGRRLVEKVCSEE
jgi:hypothetical protein